MEFTYPTMNFHLSFIEKSIIFMQKNYFTMALIQLNVFMLLEYGLTTSSTNIIRPPISLSLASYHYSLLFEKQTKNI